MKYADLVLRSTNSGLDLLHPFHTKWYNDLIENEGLVESGALHRLPDPPCIVLPDSSSTANHNITISHHDNGVASTNSDEIRGESRSNDDWWLKDDRENNCNAILIGNTKNIWPRFIQWLKDAVEEKMKGKSSENGNCTSKNKREALDELVEIGPFDTFLEESLCRVLGEFTKEGRPSSLKSYEIFWSNGKRHKVDISNSQYLKPNSSTPSKPLNGNYHCFIDEESNNNKTNEDESSSSFLVSMQRVAQVTGLYWHDIEATKLCIHPEYGTWVAFRAVVIFEWDEQIHDHSQQQIMSTLLEPPPAPSLCQCHISSMEMENAKTIFDYALSVSCASTEDDNDNDGNLGYGSQANKSWSKLCKFLHGTICGGTEWDALPETMKPWIRLRDCIEVGREEWRYGEEQLLYHYTKDPEILMSLLNGDNS